MILDETLGLTDGPLTKAEKAAILRERYACDSSYRAYAKAGLVPQRLYDDVDYRTPGPPSPSPSPVSPRPDSPPSLAARVRKLRDRFRRSKSTSLSAHNP